MTEQEFANKWKEQIPWERNREEFEKELSELLATVIAKITVDMAMSMVALAVTEESQEGGDGNGGHA